MVEREPVGGRQPLLDARREQPDGASYVGVALGGEQGGVLEG